MTTESKRRIRLPKVTFNSPVVLWFVIICVGVQVVSTLTGGASTAALFTFRPGPLSDPLTLFRHVSHVFGHISWDHLIGNMGYILLLGPLLEEKYGSPKLAIIILASSLGVSIANAIIFPTGGVVGASGVVFTLILLSSVTCLRDGEVPLTFVLVAALYIGGQVYGATFVREHISYLGHIVGGLTGAALGFLLPEKSANETGSIF